MWAREKPDVPESVGIYREKVGALPRRGVIYTLAPSYKDVNTIWAGTDDGLIHVTRDGGKSWQDVTPLGVTSWSKISIIDAGRFDDLMGLFLDDAVFDTVAFTGEV